ncbi:MAG: helix-turn-helix transcriptional regulator [Flavobacteriales bacterium]|nr:helix-turn-helix transcriptional regulator [Flavobacteriales bacterium]
MDIRLRFGVKVAEMRKIKGLSQEALAIKSNVDRSYISRIELGQTSISLVVMERIAIAMDAKIADFFN